MYTTPDDAPLPEDMEYAGVYAQLLNQDREFSHADWRLPTNDELSVMFNNRAAIGGFNQREFDPASWYWSSSPGDDYGAWSLRFSFGNQGHLDKVHPSSARLVRGDAPNPGYKLSDGTIYAGISC
jgi:hypothetical protein